MDVGKLRWNQGELAAEVSADQRKGRAEACPFPFLYSPSISETSTTERGSVYAFFPFKL
jgi:hypothetical protein